MKNLRYSENRKYQLSWIYGKNSALWNSQIDISNKLSSIRCHFYKNDRRELRHHSTVICLLSLTNHIQPSLHEYTAYKISKPIHCKTRFFFATVKTIFALTWKIMIFKQGLYSSCDPGHWCFKLFDAMSFLFLYKRSIRGKCVFSGPGGKWRAKTKWKKS